MAALAYRSTAAKEGLGAYMILHMTGSRLLFATVTAVIIAVASAGLRGVAAMVLVGLLALAFKYYFQRRLGGVTGDIFGAVAELGEAIVLVAFAVQR
jgi:adenosylcobinamide-GDP ribazoletransferase